MAGLLDNHRKNRRLTTLVENRTTYSANFAELNIYETYQEADQVALCFDFPVIASMLTGKKVMHIEGFNPFEFVPGESVVMPSNKEMVIDFPIATENDPTQCLALGIDTNKIGEVVNQFNSFTAIERENNDWTIDTDVSHLIHNTDVDVLVGRLVKTFTNGMNSKDMLLDLMVQELIVRLLQTKAKSILLNDLDGLFNDTRIGTAIQYIKQNLTNKDLTVELLAKKVCMSTSHFHKKFKNTLGVSPIDYINSEKIKFSKKLIKESKDMRMSEIAFHSGFNNVSYFNRQFKKHEMMTPQQFKLSITYRLIN
jgi:AraC-like DNA-binding protein